MGIKRFELNRKELLNHARKSLDRDDIMDALRWANKADRLYKDIQSDYEFQELYADIYECAGITETAIKHWFYALDSAEESDLNEIYDALGACFEQQGDKGTAAYYYEKLVRRLDWNKDEIDNFLSDFDEPQPERKTGFQPVPVREADYTAELGRGVDQMRRGEFKKAKKTFSSIPKGSPQYAKAANLIAISCLMDGDTETAIAFAEEQHRDNPEDVELSVTLATAYKNGGRREEGVSLCKKLIERKDLTNDESFKVAALCCELELHEEAFSYTKKLENSMPFDGNLLYMEGAAAFNAGRIEEGIDVFERLRAVYPDAAVVDYYLSYYKNGGRALMSYLYRVPAGERKRRIAQMNDICTLEKEDAPYYYMDNYSKVRACFAWCFDEMDGQDVELQALAITVALHLDAMDFLQEILLNYEVDDAVKMEIVRTLCVQNRGRELRIVCFNLYHVLSLPKLSLGRKARKKFLEGYAICISQFGLRIEGFSEILPQKAEEFYRALEEKEGLDLVSCAETVAASLCYIGGLKQGGESLRLVSLLLGADPDEVSRVLEVYRG